jgi:hypothetical protein
MALVLGGFIFTDYAIPEAVELGGEHNFVVHKLIGGDRVIDAMGRNDKDIRWSGRFQGQGALAKAMALDALRISGAQVPLIVDSQYYVVGVHIFEWLYERSYQIQYRISCVVAQSSEGASSIVGTLDGLVGIDLAAATSLVNAFATGF